MDYFFNYLVQYSKFYNETLPPKSKIYIDASYLYNFQSACYNLISKRNFKYFIDPGTYKFQYGGDRKFYVEFLDYFEEFDDLFNKEKIINLEFFDDINNFEDFYKKITRFQRTMLAKTHIPLDYYKAIADEKEEINKFNPIKNLEFVISPYFEFNAIEDKYYNLTLRYSLMDSKNYSILRFPKKILSNSENMDKIFKDFNKPKGILIDVLNLNEYDKKDLDLYFGNLIDLIHNFSSNGQKVILKSNSEFGKYLKYFGLEAVCSNVMIGQISREYRPFKENDKGGSSDFFYIPQIERAVTITNAESLMERNEILEDVSETNIRELSLNSRSENYYNSLKEKIIKINKSSIQKIIEEIQNSFNKINYNLHKNKYRYMIIWKEILQKKAEKYF